MLDAAWTVMADRAERADQLEVLLATMVGVLAGRTPTDAGGHLDDLRAVVWGPPEVDDTVLDAATEEAAVAEMAAFFARWDAQNGFDGGGE